MTKGNPGKATAGEAAPAVLEREQVPRLGGGGPNSRIPPEGSGGGDSGDFQNSDSSLPNYSERLRRCRLGLAVSMVSILMLFIALTVAYLVRQRNSAIDIAGHRVGWQKLTLPPLLMTNTIILLLSSFTLERARRELRQRALIARVESI